MSGFLVNLVIQSSSRILINVYVWNRKAVVSFSLYGELDVLMNVQVVQEYFLPIHNFEI
jgi:hypothetical protein